MTVVIFTKTEQFALLNITFLCTCYTGVMIWSSHSKFAAEHNLEFKRARPQGKLADRSKTKIAIYSPSVRLRMAAWGLGLIVTSLALEIWLLVTYKH